MATEIRVKGSVFLSVLRALEQSSGWDVRQRVVGTLDGDLGERIETGTLLASGWHPVAWHRALLGAIAAESGAIGLRDIIHVATRENVSSVHRLLMRRLSPDTLIAGAARVFSSLFEAEFGTTSIERGLNRCWWRGCHGFDVTCWSAQVHTVEAFVAMSGAKLKRRTVLSGGHAGDDAMIVEVAWF